MVLKDNIKLLKDLGFEEVGNWHLNGGSLEFQIVKSGNNILYAFVAQDTIQYIGKSKNSLRIRMNQYKKPGKTQSTNNKNNSRIKQFLQIGITVRIFALFPSEKLEYHRFPINISDGLEGNLITHVLPPWNDIK